MDEALPGVLGNRGNRAFILREQGNKGQILRGTGEQRQYWGTGNIRKQIFDFLGTGEQANLFQGNKGTGPPPGRASWMYAVPEDRDRCPVATYIHTCFTNLIICPGHTFTDWTTN